MYALRERRVHVTQEDFEMAVAKVSAVGEVKEVGGDVPAATAPCWGGINEPGQCLLGPGS